MKKYYTDDGEPIQCYECGCKKFKTKVSADLDGLPCEQYTVCQACEEYLAFWAYGHYDPIYKRSEECRSTLDKLQSWLKTSRPAMALRSLLSKEPKSKSHKSNAAQPTSSRAWLEDLSDIFE